MSVSSMREVLAGSYDASLLLANSFKCPYAVNQYTIDRMSVPLHFRILRWFLQKWARQVKGAGTTLGTSICTSITWRQTP